MSQEAISQLRTWMTEQGLDAFIVTQPQDRSYLSGWFNDDVEGAGLLLVGKQQQMLFTNPLYQEVAENDAKGWQVTVPSSYEYWAAIVKTAQEHGWQRIGFESAAITYAEYEKLRSAGEGIFTVHPFVDSFVEKLRRVKRPHEIELLKRAIAITDATFTHLCSWIQPGMTEREIQWEILRYMIFLGADSQSFEAIVASGPHGSMPHAHPSERRIQQGELITIDMGARYKGYCADMTRTICLGEPSEPRMREIYGAVLVAMKTCEAGLFAGMACKAADALARNALDVAGLAEYYIHGTGHGVGLQIHEGPHLSPRSPDDMILLAGNVVTVEPGVYIPGWSGARIEDCVLIKENGVEVLTQSPTELVLQR
ncbi:MAG: aminopeptidase P family protein [Chloroflexi bacterium]|nr:MAG: aminopeptidase P family protein [Chloroflexota bacterium]